MIEIHGINFYFTPLSLSLSSLSSLSLSLSLLPPEIAYLLLFAPRHDRGALLRARRTPGCARRRDEGVDESGRRGVRLVAEQDPKRAGAMCGARMEKREACMPRLAARQP